MSEFVVQITPLIRPNTVMTTANIVTVTQFSDLNVAHPKSGAKTATVTLSMHDPAVAALKPYAFALRVLYEDRKEPVFWGQCNISDDYENETCVLEAQDPSLRMMHHYLRRGDAALAGGFFNPSSEADKGTINADSAGMKLCIDAAQNIDTQDARNDPSLGLIASTARVTAPRTAPIDVERGQECWQVLMDIASAVLGPDFDMETPSGLTNYAELATYASMGTDRTTTTPGTPGTGKVVFDFGVGADNILGPTVRPGRPTTHAHVLSEDAAYRETAANTAASANTGGFIDWVRTGFTVAASGDTSVLSEVALARVRNYGEPPKFTEIVLRPDAVSNHNYGRPSFTRPAGTRAPTFYVGDYVTVRAVRGQRSFTLDVQITDVHLTWPGAQGPALTVLKLIPVGAGGIANDEQG